MSDGAATADPQIIFTPSGRRGRVPAGTTVLDAARSLGVDIDSVCGGRGICGRCAVVPAFGSFAKHGITSAPEHLSAPGDVEAAYRAEQRPRRGSPAVVHGRPARATPSSTSRPRARSTARSCARTSPRARSRSIRSCGCTRSTSRSPIWPRRPGDLGRLFDALRAEWGLDGPAGRPLGRSARSSRR